MDLDSRALDAGAGYRFQLDGVWWSQSDNLRGAPPKGIGDLQDGVFFRRMAVIHPKWRTPAFSLIGQGIWGAVLTMSGRYDQLYTYVIFGMVLSYTLTVIGLFVLRWKKPDVPRPYRCTGYPWLPAIYVLVGVTWTLNTIIHRPSEALGSAAIVLVGVPGYLYWRRRSQGKLAA